MRIQTIRTIRRGMAVAFVALAPLAATAAEDFTRYSNEELVQRRSEVQNLNEADRLRYREEMQNRARTLTTEERDRLGIEHDAVAAGENPARERTRRAEDNDRGQGELQRERERRETRSGYGQGYESRQGGFGGGSRGGMGGGGRGR